MESSLIRIPSDEMQACFQTILLRTGLEPEKALLCARIFTANSLEGVSSHGVNRFFHFVDYIKKGIIQPDAVPQKIASAGSLEQWDGRLGPGPLNALQACERSMELADAYGIGMVAISRTNHWMRGGTYGRHCAMKGYAFIGWTNTIANLPAWGATKNKLGNNPLVIALPFQDEPIVLDMAISQFSYGKMHELADKGENLPVYGGFDATGTLSVNPADILRSKRPLPIGYWKGSSLSLMLDLLATVLSNGLSTYMITKKNKHESGVSQVFIAISLKKLPNYPSIGNTLHQIITDFLSADTPHNESVLRYPGQHTARIRSENLAKGIPVHRAVWDKIKSLT